MAPLITQDGYFSDISIMEVKGENPGQSYQGGFMIQMLSNQYFFRAICKDKDNKLVVTEPLVITEEKLEKVEFFSVEVDQQQYFGLVTTSDYNHLDIEVRLYRLDDGKLIEALT